MSANAVVSTPNIAGFRKQEGDERDYCITTAAWRQIWSGFDPQLLSAVLPVSVSSCRPWQAFILTTAFGWVGEDNGKPALPPCLHRGASRQWQDHNVGRASAVHAKCLGNSV